MEYRLVLKDNNERAYRLFYWFLFSLHWILVTLTSLSSDERYNLWGIYIVILLYACLLLLFTGYRKQPSVFQRLHFLGYIFHGFVWWIVGIYLAIPLLLAIVLLSLYVKNKSTSIVFNDQAIMLNKIFGSEKYSWQQYENIILKDGLLTLDRKDNHLLQVEIKAALPQSEKEFNDYCHSQLVAVK